MYNLLNTDSSYQNLSEKITLAVPSRTSGLIRKVVNYLRKFSEIGNE